MTVQSTKQSYAQVSNCKRLCNSKVLKTFSDSSLGKPPCLIPISFKESSTSSGILFAFLHKHLKRNHYIIIVQISWLIVRVDPYRNL